MIKNFARLVFTAKAALDVLKEKLELKSTELLVQLKNFTEKKGDITTCREKIKHKFEEKAKEEFSQLFSEIHHKAQISELQLKGFIKDKLVELTNNALLDSAELNDIRAEIALLHAELADIKAQMKLTKTGSKN